MYRQGLGLDFSNFFSHETFRNVKSFVKHDFRVPAGFTLGLGPSRAWPVSKTSGTGTRKTSKKRLGRARARVGLRPVPPLMSTYFVV